MSDAYSSEFPLKRTPNPDDYRPEVVAAVITEMERTRKAVAPNPLSQAQYPPLPKYEKKK